MSSPTVTFRLSTYQLARGLKIIRELEPDFHLTSLSQLVKVIYHDYLAKMMLGQDDYIDPAIMQEIESFINKPSKKEISISDLIDKEESQVLTGIPKPRMSTPDHSESKISSVSDFSPPDDWKE